MSIYEEDSNKPKWRATTILCVRKGNQVVVGGDGQVSLGNTIFKSNACKIRTMLDGRVIAGFAGSAADGLALFERLEEKMSHYPNDLRRACVELAKDWRTDKLLRRLEAMLIVADKAVSLILTGNGDVLEPEDGIIAIGSGGNYALSAARALCTQPQLNLDAESIVNISLKIAAGVCVFTNDKIVIQKLVIENEPIPPSSTHY